MLKAAAKRIRDSIREGDLAARLGGDEFALVVQSGQEDFEAGCEKLAKRLVDVIGRPYEIEGRQVNVGCSIGVALPSAYGERSDELLRGADLALYKAKNSGRNCFHFYSDELKAEADQRNVLENDLRQAIWREEFELFYQPVVATDNGRVAAVEALLRWRHPTLGLVMPDNFIPLAEESGLIVRLGEWVMARACRDAKTMPDDVQSRDQHLAGAIREIQCGGRPDFRTGRCGPAARSFGDRNHGRPCCCSDSEQNLQALQQLHNIGVSIALDDFGVGYSSLSYLTSFPFNKVKIDKSFVAKADRREATAIIDLHRAIGKVAASEGLRRRHRVRGSGLGHARPRDRALPGLSVRQADAAGGARLRSQLRPSASGMPHDVSLQRRLEPSVVMIGLSNVPEALTADLSRQSASERGRIVREVAALFVDNCQTLSPEQVSLFDDVLTRLVEQIDGELRAFLAEKLAPIKKSPRKVMTNLAQDRDIAVAGPVLRQAECLSEDFLFERAETEGQEHLQAISSRERVGTRLSDTLIDRGNSQVLLTLASNAGAALSDGGYALIIERAKEDTKLATVLWNRRDISRQQVVMLFERASAAVRAAMEGTAGKNFPEVLAAIALAKRKLLDKTLDSSCAYADARARIAALREGSGVGRRMCCTLPSKGKFEELVVALSSLSELSAGEIERMLLDESDERLLVVLKAITLSWPTVRAILIATRVIPATSGQLEQTRASYQAMSSEAAAKTLKFHWLREKARGGAPAA